MDYKLLGKTGIKVSSLCMGTMTFGNEADEETSATLFNHCREAGINFFDCADVYAGGRSEEILGRLMRECRNNIILTSKVYFGTGEGVNDRGASRYHICQAVEASLKRLQTDHVDIYFIHRFPDDTSLEIVLSTMETLIQQGKILHIGASNFAAWQITKALGISALHSWNRIEVIQPMYNLLKRQAEVEILPMALAENLGVTTYSPLGAGLLTGKYVNKNDTDGRLSSHKMYQARYRDNNLYSMASEFAVFARKLGYDPAALAVAWVAAHPAVTTPILGARSLTQLQGSLKSLEIDMTSELRDQISSLTPTPPLSTDREEERDKTKKYL